MRSSSEWFELNNILNSIDKSSKISTISFGKNKPVDLGHDESAWSKNRRVEIILFN